MKDEQHESDPIETCESAGQSAGQPTRNLEEIRQIVTMMRENDLAEFKLEDRGFRLSMKRRIAMDPAPAGAPGAMSSPAAPAPTDPLRLEEPDDDCVEITSPIVGTFYRSGSPDADAYVSVGQEVDEDTVVCIIEAMKVMNEVKAEIRGVIRAILVDNATSVQYGQPLFKVEPR